MAYRHMLRRQAILAQRWYCPSSNTMAHHGNKIGDNFELPRPLPSQPKNQIMNYILPQIHKGSSISFAGIFFPHGVKCMSSTIGEGSDHVYQAGEASELIITQETVKVMTAHAPNVNEVVIAASDSAFPSAFVQYLIDWVHTFTGLDWWAAIAISTILVHSAALPLQIMLLKEGHKIRSDKRRLLEVKQELQKLQTMSIIFNDKSEMEAFVYFALYGNLIWKRILLQSSIVITFFCAISNMAEKVPSLKIGGALWFTDLTTPDSFYILPVLTSLVLLLHYECNIREGWKRAFPSVRYFDFYGWILCVFTVPFLMRYSQAFLFYWISTYLFYFSFGLALRLPEVRIVLGLPVLTRPKPSASQSGQSGSSSA